MEFKIQFSGHENIRSLHQKTIEITKESYLTTSGDCIIGVNATCGCADLPDYIKEKLRDSGTLVGFSIKVNEHEFELEGHGHPELTFENSNDIVLRKSDFISDRTLAINCDKASDIIPRHLVKLLQDPNVKGTFTIKID